MKVKESSGNSGGFGPQVFTPGDPARVTDPTVARLLGEGAAPESVPYVGAELLSALTDATPTSERLKTTRDQLLQIAVPLIEAVKQFAADAEREFLDEIRAELREVKKQGEAQEGICRELDNHRNVCQSELNRLEDVKSKASLKVWELNEERKHLNRWAPDSKIRALEQQIATATAAHTKSLSEHARKGMEYNAMWPKIEAANQRLTYLSNRADQLKSVILNQQFNYLGMKVDDPRAWFRHEKELEQRRISRAPKNAA